MEITTIFGFIIAASSGMFTSYFVSLLNVLISFFCYREIVDTSIRVRALDDKFAACGWTQARYLDVNHLPADGLHCLFIWGIIIGHRTTVRTDRNIRIQYELFIFGRFAYKHIKKLLDGDSTTINVAYCDQPALWRGERNTVPYILEYCPTKWQSELISTIMHIYEKRRHASVIIYGDPGLGKSQVAMLLNREMSNYGNYEPTTVVADPTSRGLTVNDIVYPPQNESPVIVLFNEYDRVVKNAEESPELTSDGVSIACNKTSLLNALDRINAMKNVILIATMNAKIESLAPAYTRKGRFDIQYYATGDPIEIVIE